MEQSIYSLHAESRRYDRYMARMLALKRMLRFAKRHRLAIAATALVLAAAVCVFLLTIGTFSGSLNCTDLTYGETPAGSMTAFLSDVQYQYACIDGDPVWSDQTPTQPGQYRIRAVSHNGFGQERYSESATFTLLPRKLDVQINDGSYIYGDFTADLPQENTVFNGLANGDRPGSLEFDLNQDEDGNFRVSLKHLTLINSSGQDVTACYEISSAGGTYSMLPRPLTVTAQDAQKVYDGEPWEQSTWVLSAGTLVDGDQIEVTFAPAPASAGSHTLTPHCTVHNESGADVTAHYQITAQNGTLTVRRRPITVETGSAQKTYDATALTEPHWSMTDGDLLPGHTLSGTVTGSRTVVGQNKNIISLQVTDEQGNDLTENYAFTVRAGTLTIDPIVLKFKTGSAEAVYSGLELTCDDWKLVSGAVIAGHTLSCHTTGTQTNAGSSLNALQVVVKNANGRDVTAEGYRIETEHGVLTVTPRPITITSNSAEKLYDGYPLVCHTYQIDKNAFNFGTWKEYISCTYFTGSQREVGSSSNTFTVDIADNYGKITTFNYDITYVYGTLTVLENPNPPEQGTSSPSGSGLPGNKTVIDFPEDTSEYLYAQVMGYSGFQSPTQVHFRYLSYGDYTGNGWNEAQQYSVTNVSPLLYVGRSLRENASIKIHLINGCPALLPYFTLRDSHETLQTNDCFYVQDALTYNVDMSTEYSYSVLANTTINTRLAAEEKVYRDFVYGQYLQIPDSTKTALLQWASQNGIRSDSPTLAEDIQSAIINAAAYNANGTSYPEGVDVAVYFLTEAKEGVCQHFATAATLMYRAFGIPARYTVGFVDTLLKGEVVDLTSADAHAWVEIYVDGLGWVPMEVTGGISSENVKTQLTVQAYSATKLYDGEGFNAYDLAKYTILYGNLRSGHRLEVKFEQRSYAATPGEYSNRIVKCVVYDENGEDVTSRYYVIHVLYGDVTILRRPVTVTLGSASKVYDGESLSCQDYWISQGSLAPGHELVVTTDSSLTDPGLIANTASDIRIYCKQNSVMVDVTQYYEITVIDGKLEVATE